MKHLPESVSTVQRHLHQERHNLQSTHPKPKKMNLGAMKDHFQRLNAKKRPGQTLLDVFKEELDRDSFLPSPSPNIKTHDITYIIINRDDICTAYTDLTGRFPCRSSSGNEYLLIAYHYDGSVIVAKPLKNGKK